MNRRFVAAILGRVIGCVVLLGLGYGAMSLLASMKEPPVKAEIRENARAVKVSPAQFEDVPITITGYGQVRARDVVAISSEVAGRVVESHPRLEVGEVIPKGDVLFRIDPRDYQAQYDEVQATQALWQNTIRRLKRQFAIDRERHKTLARSRELAAAEHARVKQLYIEDRIVTQSVVDQAEISANAATDAADQMAQALDLYPIRIQEAESSLAAAAAQGDRARAAFDRTTVIAPFDARVTSVDLEVGQYVAVGTSVVTLADDSVLEISVPIDSRQARDWLRFDSSTEGRGDSPRQRAWFDALSEVPVNVYWTESSNGKHWPGMLHRVEKFDHLTRMLTVAIRIDGCDAVSGEDGGLPLVEGMFCRIEIPGRIARGVVKLPAEAVGFDLESSGFRTVYVAAPAAGETLRLKTVKVLESHVDGEFVYIAKGIEEGDLVITTRLVNPIENILLEAEREPPGDPDA